MKFVLPWLQKVLRPHTHCRWFCDCRVSRIVYPKTVLLYQELTIFLLQITLSSCAFTFFVLTFISSLSLSFSSSPSHSPDRSMIHLYLNSDELMICPPLLLKDGSLSLHSRFSMFILWTGNVYCGYSQHKVKCNYA